MAYFTVLQRMNIRSLLITLPPQVSFVNSDQRLHLLQYLPSVKFIQLFTFAVSAPGNRFG